jgi:hypothetical protein
MNELYVLLWLHEAGITDYTTRNYMFIWQELLYQTILSSRPRWCHSHKVKLHKRLEPIHELKCSVTRSKHEVQLRKFFGIKSHGKVNGEKHVSDVSYVVTRHWLLLQSISFSGVTGKTVSTFRRNLMTSSSGSKSKPCKEAARAINWYQTQWRHICSFLPTALHRRKRYSSQSPPC